MAAGPSGRLLVPSTGFAVKLMPAWAVATADRNTMNYPARGSHAFSEKALETGIFRALIVRFAVVPFAFFAKIFQKSLRDDHCNIPAVAYAGRGEIGILRIAVRCKIGLKLIAIHVCRPYIRPH